MTPTEARERAEQIASSVDGGKGYHGRLWDAIAHALLLAQAEAYEDAYNAVMLSREARAVIIGKAATLRRQAEEIAHA
jgi:hypothetical protein